MSETAGYPIMLNLRDRLVAVVGGGRVGERKTRGLLKARARVLLISGEATSELRRLWRAGRIRWIAENYRRDLLTERQPVLVIAATDDDRVNQLVAQDAHRIRALCNVAASGAMPSDFSDMARIDQPPLTIALSSGGKSPALTRLLKARLEDEIGAEYATLAAWLGDLRERANAGIPDQADRQVLYEQILLSDALTLCREGDVAEARRVFDQLAREGMVE